MEFNQDNILQELNDKGVYVIDSFITGDELAILNKEYDTILSTENLGMVPMEYSIGKRVVVYKKDYDKSSFPGLTRFFYNNDFEQLAKSYLKDEIDLNKEIFVVKDVVGSKHIANDLHYDVLKTFKYFLYLTDTTTKNGAFTCVPGSHKRTAEYRKDKGNQINFNNRYMSRDLEINDFPPEIPIEGKAGTLIIFDTDVWHRGGIVSEGERRVMIGHTRVVKEEENFNTNTKKPTIFRRVLNKLKS